MDRQTRGIITDDLVGRHRLDSTACLIEQVFKNTPENFNCVIDLSNRIKRQIEVMDPFIQENTLAICSKCKDSCCVTRYSYYNCDDLIYIMALGHKPQKLQGGDESGPCTFLTNNGCCLERTVRPSGCNWYICDALDRQMRVGPSEAYADFSDNMEKLFNLWMELISEFRSRFKKLTDFDLEAFDLASDCQRKASRRPVAARNL
jgi:hypothetical protein